MQHLATGLRIYLAIIQFSILSHKVFFDVHELHCLLETKAAKEQIV